ncbi:MAG: hypothetical protein FWC14_00440 [Candidatus Bathyarchaeota archaeon]|uniref:hypothetical protein n=1 Tax=Candidatus Bathycorpusculum sp. TaxID=2994959 RepID=UPI00281ADEF7|nr:hypothetical protein [Candidatus Termiticorpusculum sp.]MCL2292799.1 hypothetical protein [Candidatus Termiticorpusculum sp.]
MKNLKHLGSHLSKINWFGVVGGILTLVVIIVSLYNPWWRLTIGADIVKINVSPMNTNFGLLGAHFTIPLISALNIGSILTFLCSGIIMLIYSMAPTKPYAKDLLDFAWKKPLYSVITSTLCLSLIVLVAHAIFDMAIPLVGTATVILPEQFTTEDVGVIVKATAAFQWPLYLAITAAILCIIARIYHKKQHNI